MAAGVGQHHRLPAEHFDRFVVDDLPVLQKPVVTVARVGIEGHVADDAQRVATLLANRPHRAAGEVFRIEGMSRIVGLPRWLHHGKDRDRRNAEPQSFTGGADDALNRQPLDARHARHGQRHLVVVHEQRPDEIGGGERGLGDGASQPVVPPHAAEAGVGKPAGKGLHHHGLLSTITTDPIGTGGGAGFPTSVAVAQASSVSQTHTRRAITPRPASTWGATTSSR